MTKTKEQLIAERAAIEATVKGIDAQLAELEQEIAAAPAAVESERVSLTRSILARLKPDPTKMMAAQAKRDALIDARRILLGQRLAAEAPLAGIGRELARIQLAEWLAEGAGIVADIKALEKAGGEKFVRLCQIADSVEGVKASYGIGQEAAAWLNDEVYFSRYVGQAAETLNAPRGDWAHGFEKPRPAPLAN